MRKTIVTSEVIVLGRQGEDGANKVLFPVRGWKELYGDGQFVVTVLRPEENDPYPVSITLNGVFVEWIVGSADVEIVGRGKVELAYFTSDNVRAKSVVYHTVIHDALGQNSLEPPEPWQSWVDDVEAAGVSAIQAAEDAESAATRAEDAADLAEDYADDAERFADDAEDAAQNAQEAAQNAQGAVSAAFGQITANATTLSPGSSATASFDPSTKVMSFGIPQGEKGELGENNIVVYRLREDGTQKSSSGGYASYVDGATTPEKIKTDYAAGRTVVLDLEYSGIRTPNTFGDGRHAYLTVMPNITADGGGRAFDGYVYIDGVVKYVKVMCKITYPSSKAEITFTDLDFERTGKITVGSTAYTPTRKALSITDNGVTTTYYVADIT